MHIAYLQAVHRGHQLTACPLCVIEKQLVTDALNGIFPETELPCPEHGDPSYLFPENEDAMMIYNTINNHGNFVFHQNEQGVSIRRFNLDIVLRLCESLGADFWETLPKLEIIHEELYG